MTDAVERFRVVATGRPAHVVNGELADRIKALVCEYADQITVAAAIGVLEIVQVELFREQDG